MKLIPSIPWPRILAEGAIIIVSILLAFWIDAWWEGLAQSKDEVESLALIRRDLESAIELLERHAEYSAGAAKSALSSYKALSGPGPYDRDRIHNEMLRIDRITLKIPTGAYTELLSTGNLRVIQDRELRDAIVGFYESAELNELFLQKNNDVFLDRQLFGAYYGQGLVFAHASEALGDAYLDAAYDLMKKRLGPDFVHQPDPMWNFETDSREWQILRSLLLSAAMVHTIGELTAEEQRVDARILFDAVDNWLSRH